MTRLSLAGKADVNHRRHRRRISENLWPDHRLVTIPASENRQLYRIEDETRDLSRLDRKAVRQHKAPALWRAMKHRAWALRAQPRFLPQSSLGKAVNYFLKEYTAAAGYLRDGQSRIDNHLVENEVRPSVVGRQRWLFIGHPDAGWRRAVISMIIQSCRRRGLNPQEYLTDVLGRLPAMKSHQTKDVLPSRWQPSGSATASPATP